MSTKDEKIVVVTGCSSGIGLETAALLAKEKGYKVIATMRNLKKKEALEQEAGSTLNKSLFIRELDISKEDSILKFVKETIEKEGRIDVLVNNAATGQAGKFEDVTLEQMQNLFQTNFFGTARITQEVIRKMKEQRSGRIIFISSLVGVEPMMFGEFYCATKFAIEALVAGLAPVMRTFNIRVTSVVPGPVQTAFAKNITENKQGSFAFDEIQDAEIKPLVDNYFGKEMAEMATAMQTGKDVGEVIKKCIEDERPSVRIPTSEFVKARAEAILVDYTGNTIAEKMEAKLH